MADKKISIIVEAVVGAARRNLQGLNKDFNNLGQGADSLAGRLRTQGETAKDTGLVLEQLGYSAKEVRQALKGAGYEVESIGASFDVMGAGATIAKGALAAVAAAFVAIKFGEKAIEIADAAAAGVALRESFDDLAARVQVDSTILLQSLKEASRGTIAEYDLMKEGNEAWYLGIAQNVKQYSDLMKIAEVKSKDLGMSTLEYWQRLNTAIASGYPIGMRQLGIIIDNEQAYRDYAASIGFAADELTDQGEIQARVNAIIADGEPALQRWETAGKDATTTTQEFHAAAADLRAEIGERLLPILIPAIESFTAALEGANDPLDLHREAIYKTAGSYDELFNRIAKVQVLQQYGGRWTREGIKDWQEITGTMETHSEVMRVLSDRQHDLNRYIHEATKEIEVLADTEDHAVASTEKLSDVVDKASDIYDKYVRDVQEANYRFGRSVADANFRAAQAAEDSAFRRYEIERNAAQKYDDDLRQHTASIRRQWQDLHDALSDIEYDYQQDRKDLLKQSPWWIRQALQKEFAERKRVADTGDAKALETYDKALREKIRAIDPVYAQELDELQEQYDRKETVEQREAQQARRRTEDDFREQARITERELRDQLEAWRFHDQQRGENERRAMDNLIADNAHRLQILYDDTNRRLAELDVIWKQWGYSHGASYIDKLQHVLSSYTPTLPGPQYTPIPPGYEFPSEWTGFQRGAWEVPQTMPAIIHKGEMVVPAGPAEHMREGGINIEIGQIVLGGGYGPQQGKQLARDMAEELGPMIRKQSRG